MASANEIFEFGFVPVIGKNEDSTLPGIPQELVRTGQFKQCDIIFGEQKFIFKT